MWQTWYLPLKGNSFRSGFCFLETLSPEGTEGCHSSLLFEMAAESQVLVGTCYPGLWHTQLIPSLCTSGEGLQLSPGAWLAICRLSAAAAAAWGAGMVWEGPGAPCFTVLVASIVLSAPWERILLADVDTEGNRKSQWENGSEKRKTQVKMVNSPC